LCFSLNPGGSNLLILVPFVTYQLWKRKVLAIPKRILFVAFFFAIAFGFVEAAVVIYLRAAV
jgi:hypothetical protein